jgi:hypothetical protein
MDERGLLIRGIAFTLIGLAFFGALALSKWRRRLTPLEQWSIVLAANGILAGGLSNLMLAGVVPGDATAARWTGDGVGLLLVAATICNGLQAVKNRRGEGEQTAGIVEPNVVVQTAAPTTPPSAQTAAAPSITAQVPAEPAVQNASQGRN